ncbi:hypothetical protein D3C86_1730130 [compost metagenome]
MGKQLSFGVLLCKTLSTSHQLSWEPPILLSKAVQERTVVGIAHRPTDAVVLQSGVRFLLVLSLGVTNQDDGSHNSFRVGIEVPVDAIQQLVVSLDLFFSTTRHDSSLQDLFDESMILLQILEENGLLRRYHNNQFAVAIDAALDERLVGNQVLLNFQVTGTIIGDRYINDMGSDFVDVFADQH